MPFLSFLMVVSLAISAGASASLDAKECSALLVKRAHQQSPMQAWSELPIELGNRASATVLIRVNLKSITAGISDLMDSSWATKTGVNSVNEFTSITQEAWYMVIDGDRSALMSAHSSLAEKFPASELSFEVLGAPTTTEKFELSQPTHYIEIGSKTESAETKLEDLLNGGESAEQAAAIYDQHTGQMFFAIPEAKLKALNSDLLQALEISSAENRDAVPLAEWISQQSPQNPSSFILLHGGHWILSQPAYRSIKELEGQSLQLPLRATPDHVAEFLRLKISSHSCREDICVSPIPEAAPAVPGDLPSPLVGASEIQLLSETQNGLLQIMMEALKDQSGINWKVSKSLETSFTLVAKKHLTPQSLMRMNQRLMSLPQANWDGLNIYKLLHGDSHPYTQTLRRMAAMWKLLALELLPEFAAQPVLTPQNIRALSDLLVAKDVLVAENAAVQLPVSSVNNADVALLRDLKNQLMTDMLTVLKKQSGLSWAYSGSLHANFNAVADQLLSAEARSRTKDQFALQKNMISDGPLLYSMTRGKELKSDGPVQRFVELWKILASELAPQNGSAAALNAENIRSTIQILDSDSLPSESLQVVQKQPSPRRQPTIDLPLESIKLINSFMSENTEGSWWERGRVVTSFEEVFAKVASKYEMTKIKDELAKIPFSDSDASNSRKGGKALRNLLAALKLLAIILDPELALQPQSPLWIEKLTNKYNIRLEKLRTAQISAQIGGAQATETLPKAPPALLIRGDQRDLTKGNGSEGYEPKNPVVVDGSLPRNTEVTFGPEVKSFTHLKSSHDFLDFIRGYAHFAVDGGRRNGHKELIYFLNGHGSPVLLSFVAEHSPAGSRVRLHILDIRTASQDVENQIYTQIARDHEVPAWNYDFKGGRLLKVGAVSAASVYISGKVMAKIQVKHRLSKVQMDRILSGIRAVNLCDRDSYCADVEVDGTSYRIYLAYTAGGPVSVQTIYDAPKKLAISRRR